MSSPEAFARGNGSYWTEVVPRLEQYVRSQMLALDRFAAPLELKSAPERHALVAELAFEQFAQECDGLVRPRPARIAETVVETVVDRIRGFAGGARKSRRPTPRELDEAWILRLRLHRFVGKHMRVKKVHARPPIPGCGSLRSAEGDLLGVRYEPDFATQIRDSLAALDPSAVLDPVDPDHRKIHESSVLYEVKSVHRKFGSQDVRQLLVYSAMLQAAASPPRYVGLVNPRLGTFIEWKLNDLCLNISGSGMDDVLLQIITDISVGVSG